MRRLAFPLLIFVILVGLAGCVTVNTKSGASPSIPWIGSPPAIETFTVSPSTITSGEAVTLSWKVNGATAVRIEPGVGNVDASGSRTITPAESTTYTLSTTNAAGTVTRSFYVVVRLKPSVPVPFAVSEVTAGLEPSVINGCYTMYADITTNGAGNVSYIWESSNGEGYSYTWTITFPTAGTQRVTLPVEMSALPTGPYRLRVLTPNEIVSNSTLYITCAKY